MQERILGMIVCISSTVLAGLLIYANIYLYVNVISYSFIIPLVGSQISFVFYLRKKERNRRFFYGYLLSTGLCLIVHISIIPPYTYEQAVQIVVEEVGEEVEIVRLAPSAKRSPIVNRSAWFIQTAYYIQLRSVKSDEKYHYLVFPQNGDSFLLDHRQDGR